MRNVPPYRRTAVPPYRRTAVPPYRRTAVPPYRRTAVPPYRPSAPLILSNTAYHIARVSFPVLVFCLLGWNEVMRRLPSGIRLSRSCPNTGRSLGGRRSHQPD